MFVCSSSTPIDDDDEDDNDNKDVYDEFMDNKRCKSVDLIASGDNDGDDDDDDDCDDDDVFASSTVKGNESLVFGGLCALYSSFAVAVVFVVVGVVMLVFVVVLKLCKLW